MSRLSGAGRRDRGLSSRLQWSGDCCVGLALGAAGEGLGLLVHPASVHTMEARNRKRGNGSPAIGGIVHRERLKGQSVPRTVGGGCDTLSVSRLTWYETATMGWLILALALTLAPFIAPLLAAVPTLWRRCSSAGFFCHALPPGSKPEFCGGWAPPVAPVCVPLPGYLLGGCAGDGVEVEKGWWLAGGGSGAQCARCRYLRSALARQSALDSILAGAGAWVGGGSASCLDAAAVDGSSLS